MTVITADEARAKLEAARKTRGELARIARDSGVTYRTLHNILGTDREPTADTLKKLAAQFKKDERKPKK